MKGTVEERALLLGSYIAQNGATVRAAAKRFGISKSTVHTDDTKLNDKKPLSISERGFLIKYKIVRAY